MCKARCVSCTPISCRHNLSSCGKTYKMDLSWFSLASCEVSATVCIIPLVWQFTLDHFVVAQHLPTKNHSTGITWTITYTYDIHIQKVFRCISCPFDNGRYDASTTCQHWPNIILGWQSLSFQNFGSLNVCRKTNICYTWIHLDCRWIVKTCQNHGPYVFFGLDMINNTQILEVSSSSHQSDGLYFNWSIFPVYHRLYWLQNDICIYNAHIGTSGLYTLPQ